MNGDIIINDLRGNRLDDGERARERNEMSSETARSDTRPLDVEREKRECMCRAFKKGLHSKGGRMKAEVSISVSEAF